MPDSTSKPANNRVNQNTLTSSDNDKTHHKVAKKEVKYGHHKVKVTGSQTPNTSKTSHTPSPKAIHPTTHTANHQNADVYTEILTTLALFADTLAEAGLHEEAAFVLSTLTAIIKDHEKSEERKAENERLDAQEDKRRDEQYLRDKQAIKVLYERLLNQRSSLKLQEHTAQLDDYLKRMEASGIKS